MTTLNHDEWEDIGKRLREAFDPRDVDFRVQGKASEETGKAQVVAFVDARAVQDRLDMVVGPGGWSFAWEPITVKGEQVMVAKGTLTIHDIAKSDAGSASNFEQSLGAVSHCFKRAAVHWGIGRYLYNVPGAYVAVEKGGRIPQQTLAQLRAKLPRPGQVQTQQQPRAEVLPEEDPTAISQPGANTAQLWDFLRDFRFRERCKALGYLSIQQVEELVATACGGAGQPVSKAKVRDHLLVLEARAQQAGQASDLRQAFTGQART